MKFSCNTEKMYTALQTVQKAIANKPLNPVTGGVYLSVRDNILELQATDYELSIKYSMPVDMQEEGKTVLQGRFLMDIIRRLPGEQVDFSTSRDDNMIHIQSKHAFFQLVSMEASEYPLLQSLPQNQQLALQREIVSELIKKTSFACAQDSARPIYMGVLLEAADEELCMVGTDTHRLAFKKISSQSINLPIRFLIPAKTVNELIRLFGLEETEEIKVYWHQNQIAFAFGSVYILSRLIEGQFPDYKKVIPSFFATTVEVDTEEMNRALQLVSLLARENDYSIIHFHFKEGEIIITSKHPDLGKATESISCSGTGNEVEISFNANYFLDAVKNMDTEKIKIELNTPLSPICIRPTDDDSFIYVLTPVRVR